jgi:hypothetical protein
VENIRLTHEHFRDAKQLDSKETASLAKDRVLPQFWRIGHWAFGHWVLGIGYWVLGFGHWVFWILDARILDWGFGMQGLIVVFNAPCPMRYALCPMPHAPCPMPHAHFSLKPAALSHLNQKLNRVLSVLFLFSRERHTGELANNHTQLIGLKGLG